VQLNHGVISFALIVAYLSLQLLLCYCPDIYCRNMGLLETPMQMLRILFSKTGLKWRMKANESKSIHVTFTTRRETCPPVHINIVQLPQEEDIKYFGLHLDRRLTWHKHIFAKRKQLGIALTKMYWATRTKVKMLYTQQTTQI
jgi:hypothetical protein